ncbi:GATA zinc finger domain-containing protein 14-like [Vanessa cardui]|uniref:GATA zinc finger domain-containing protein 14-like n=1 Tax=Vanessa cardui TaxID=171605 RepID=UPI001F12A977|nr:GATA zinc finger domain-containing protein 14-like [Vanessa cardui]
MVWKIVLVICLSGYVQSERGAISEQRVVIHQIKSEQSDKPIPVGSKKSEYREEYAWSYPSYEFSYKVNDPETKDIKGQHEKRHGDEVKGLYWLIEPNGHKRTVNYQADDNHGFNAQVDYTAKQHSTEYKSKNSDENNEVEEKSKKIHEYNGPNEENKSNDKEQEKKNNEENVNEQKEESHFDEQHKDKSQHNDDAVKDDISKQTENNEENKNNENNEMNIENNKNECCSENSEHENIKPVHEENQENNIDYNNRRKSRDNVNRNENWGKPNEMKNEKQGRSRLHQNNNKLRHRENNEQNRKSGAHSKRSEDNQKHVTRELRASKNKENIDIDLKNDNDEKKEQSNNHELRLALNTNKGNVAHVTKNIKETKSHRFEHRIRIHHPEPNVKI